MSKTKNTCFTVIIRTFSLGVIWLLFHISSLLFYKEYGMKKGQLFSILSFFFCYCVVVIFMVCTHPRCGRVTVINNRYCCTFPEYPKHPKFEYITVLARV